MTVAELLENPLVITVIVPFLVAMGTLALPKFLDRWKDRRHVDAQDQERLSLSEEKFRVAIMQDLKDCRTENAAVHKQNAEVSRLHNAALRRIDELEVKVQKLEGEVSSLQAGTPIVFKPGGHDKG